MVLIVFQNIEFKKSINQYFQHNFVLSVNNVLLPKRSFLGFKCRYCLSSLAKKIYTADLLTLMYSKLCNFILLARQSFHFAQVEFLALDYAYLSLLSFIFHFLQRAFRAA